MSGNGVLTFMKNIILTPRSILKGPRRAVDVFVGEEVIWIMQNAVWLLLEAVIAKM